MINEPNIRPIQKEDLRRLVHLCELHAAFEQAEYDVKLKEEKLNKYIFSNNPSLYGLVAEKDKNLIGYATYMKQFSTWNAEHYIYMDCLFLIEEARGSGIGEKLIDRIKEETKKLNCKLIQWQTPDFNTRAMKFYDRIGAYRKTKERYFLEIEKDL